MKLKFAFLYFVLIFSIENLYSQSNWLWAKSSQTFGNGIRNSCASVGTDATGNIIITGEFHNSSIKFGSITLVNADPSGFRWDFYIVKYDSSGNVLWAKRAGGTNYDEGEGVCTDSNGNIFATGHFYSGTIIFGSDTLTNSQQGTAGSFIVKYDSNGNVLWAKSVQGLSIDWGYSVSADPSGNVFVTGEFSSDTLYFGSSVIVTKTSSTAVFVAKYDPNGNVLWAKSNVGTFSANDRGCSVSADPFGNAFVVGHFASLTATFGTTTLTNSATSGTFDFFIAKYDPNGNVLWAKSAAGTKDETGFSVSTDAAGNAYVTGHYLSPTMSFGNIVLTNINNNNNGNVFVVKYEASGGVVWAESSQELSQGSNNSDVGRSISVNTAGNIFVTGCFSSDTISFGSQMLTPPTNSSGTIFVATYDPNGNVLCATYLISGDWGVSAIAADLFGNAAVVGNFGMNPFIVGADTLTRTGIEDLFISKYRCENNVGLHEFGNGETISIYPNPSNGIFTLNSQSAKGEIYIYNLLGEVIYKSKMNSSVSRIDLSEHANGIYFVRIISSSEIYSGKLLKQ